MKKLYLFAILVAMLSPGCASSKKPIVQEEVHGNFCKRNNPEITGCVFGTDYAIAKNGVSLSKKEKTAAIGKITKALKKWENDTLEARIREFDGFGEHEIVDLGSVVGMQGEASGDTDNLLFAWKWREVVVLSTMPIKKVFFLLDEKSKTPTVQFKYSMSEIADQLYRFHDYNWTLTRLIPEMNSRKITINHPSEMINHITVDTLTIRISPEQLKSGNYTKATLPN